MGNRLRKIENALNQAECKVTRKGNSLQAQCPAHDDEHPSLSIEEKSGGKILMTCHAGCDTDDVMGELGLGYQMLFPGEPSGRGRSNRKMAAYDYTNEDGRLLYQAVRFYPKKFRQRQPKTGGGWQWNLKGVRRVIYNLPQVNRSVREDKPVFLVEGEKDAQSLIKRDLCGTTAPMGAGQWKPEFNEYVEGAQLIIVPDNDHPGKQHAVNVAKQLFSTAQSIRVVLLPDLEPKEDVSDWLAKGGTAEKLLELAFESDPIRSVAEAKALMGIKSESEEYDPRNLKEQFFEEGLKTYSNDKEERVVADFTIDIKSIVKDDREGKIFYVQISELDRGRHRTTDMIEIRPDCLDHLRSFYKTIRPYSMGEIIQYRRQRTKPLAIFKWLLESFDKPIVRRPDHLGYTRGPGGRPIWLFGNAAICPPWKTEAGKIVKPNPSDEFIIGQKLGFTLPLYNSKAEKDELVPYIQTGKTNVAAFLGEVKTRLIRLIGGGDPEGRAKNYGKLLLAYVIYHLYEEELYYANDINGHTVMFYVFGPKGTGKTTYFNTILQAFFGLEKTKDHKGNSVSVAGIETIMSAYSHLPVCYDEYNPEGSDIDYQAINGYYHKTTRSVSDPDQKKRNKFINIRSTFSITSNYRINLDVDQADATQSRTIYFQYKKAYRSEDADLFKWMKDHLHQLSSITAHLLLHQTDQKRAEVKRRAQNQFESIRKRLKEKIKKNPAKYAEEHRLTSNYTRLLACYELVFGEDKKLRGFVISEILQRFAHAKANETDSALLNQMIYLASSGRLKESWHYHYSNNQKKLYVDMNQCYQTYENDKRDNAISRSQFREIFKEYFTECGGYDTGSPRWYGSYFDFEHNKVEVDKTQHSYIVNYSQLNNPGNMLKDLFPPGDDHREVLQGMEQSKQMNIENEPPF